VVVVVVVAGVVVVVVVVAGVVVEVVVVGGAVVGGVVVGGVVVVGEAACAGGGAGAGELNGPQAANRTQPPTRTPIRRRLSPKLPTPCLSTGAQSTLMAI
jgi:hypothetical protein